MNSNQLSQRMSQVIADVGCGKVTIKFGNFILEIEDFYWCVDCQQHHIAVENEKDCYTRRGERLKKLDQPLRIVK